MTHPMKQGLFAVLSAADFGLTFWLLARAGGGVAEANPVAAWVLASGGWAGLAAFKLASVLTVLGLAGVIARRDAASAGRVLSLGCLVVGAVVAYSVGLGARGEGPELADARRRSEEADRELARRARPQAEYRRLLAKLSAEYLGGRVSLREGAAALAASEWGRDEGLRGRLQMAYGCAADEQGFAVMLALHASESLGKGAPGWPALVRRLHDDYRRDFGVAAPRDLAEMRSQADWAERAVPSARSHEEWVSGATGKRRPRNLGRMSHAGERR